MPKPPAPCTHCGGPKAAGRGRRTCDSCRDEQRAMWERRIYQERLERMRTARRDGGYVNRSAEAPPGTKWCNRCTQYLDVSEFAPRGGGRSGPGALTAYCAPCRDAYGHERRLLREFGLTLERYEELLALQDHRCAICRKKPRQRRLAVDHDHESGEVRGLLCTRCNHKILGSADENPAILRRAARYLESPPAPRGEPLHAIDEDEEMLEVISALTQAREGDGLPMVVWRPDTYTDAQLPEWPVILRLEDFTRLAIAAGYGSDLDALLSRHGVGDVA